MIYAAVYAWLCALLGLYNDFASDRAPGVAGVSSWASGVIVCGRFLSMALRPTPVDPDKHGMLGPKA